MAKKKSGMALAIGILVVSAFLVWRMPGHVETDAAPIAPARTAAGGCRCPDTVAAWMRDPADWPADAFVNVDICGMEHALSVDLSVEHGAADGGFVEVTVNARAFVNGAGDDLASVAFAAAFLETHAVAASGTNSRNELEATLESFAVPVSGMLFARLTDGELICVHRYGVRSENYRP